MISVIMKSIFSVTLLLMHNLQIIIGVKKLRVQVVLVQLSLVLQEMFQYAITSIQSPAAVKIHLIKTSSAWKPVHHKKNFTIFNRIALAYPSIPVVTWVTLCLEMTAFRHVQKINLLLFLGDKYV
jgi:hypothetical protein